MEWDTDSFSLLTVLLLDSSKQSFEASKTTFNTFVIISDLRINTSKTRAV